MAELIYKTTELDEIISDLKGRSRRKSFVCYDVEYVERAEKELTLLRERVQDLQVENERLCRVYRE